MFVPASKDAAAALTAEGGLAAATIDAIRSRSGVSRTTVGKDWPNRLFVAVDAFAQHLDGVIVGAVLNGLRATAA